MATLSSQLESIERKIRQLVQHNDNLKLELDNKIIQERALQEKNNELIKALQASEDRNVNLKTANAMLGSDEYKTKTKLKINALVKEIDQCISQLA